MRAPRVKRSRLACSPVLAIARTCSLVGVEAREVRVEIDVRRGLPSFALVGLPDAAVRESRERVRAALVNSGFEFPLRRITANLAPADVRKAGPGFDLAIAAALLVASDQLRPEAIAGVALAGELALDGSIRPVPGVLAMAEAAGRTGAEAIAVPVANGREAAIATSPRVIPLESLAQLELLNSDREPPAPAALDLTAPPQARGGSLDLDDLRGQPCLRLALEVAAAGGHSLLITGPPGAGKSMAARRLPSIMPPLEPREANEVMRIAGACGRSFDGDPRRPPFRAPHHTISAAGLVGGGTPPRPGEVTLAHRGVLFLDELGEFSRMALEALRQPLEDGWVLLSRAWHSVELPCRTMLVAAANPCPCGLGTGEEVCDCPPAAIRRYHARLSGALADRIDLIIGIGQPSAAAMAGPAEEPSSAVRERVLAARERQRARLGDGRSNAETAPRELQRKGRIAADARRVLADGHARLGLSGRGHDRVLRVARTVADLRGCERVDAEHVAEALSLRRREAER